MGAAVEDDDRLDVADGSEVSLAPTKLGIGAVALEDPRVLTNVAVEEAIEHILGAGRSQATVSSKPDSVSSAFGRLMSRWSKVVGRVAERPHGSGANSSGLPPRATR